MSGCLEPFPLPTVKVRWVAKGETSFSEKKLLGVLWSLLRFLIFAQLCTFLSGKASGAFCCGLMLQVNERIRHLIHEGKQTLLCDLQTQYVFFLWCLMSMGLFLLEKVLGGQFKVGHCWVWLFCSINTVVLILRVGKYHGSRGIRVLEQSWECPYEWVQLQPARTINTFAKLQNMPAGIYMSFSLLHSPPQPRANAGI